VDKWEDELQVMQANSNTCSPSDNKTTERSSSLGRGVAQSTIANWEQIKNPIDSCTASIITDDNTCSSSDNETEHKNCKQYNQVVILAAPLTTKRQKENSS